MCGPYGSDVEHHFGVRKALLTPIPSKLKSRCHSDVALCYSIYIVETPATCKVINSSAQHFRIPYYSIKFELQGPCIYLTIFFQPVFPFILSDCCTCSFQILITHKLP